MQSVRPVTPRLRARTFALFRSFIPGRKKLPVRLSSEPGNAWRVRRQTIRSLQSLQEHRPRAIEPSATHVMDEETQTLTLYNRSLAWLSRKLAAPDAPLMRARLIVAGAIIFGAAFGVRLVHWQDHHLKMGADQSGLVNRYKQQAQRMVDGDGLLFPRDYDQHASMQWILHPPVYSIFIGGVYELFGKADDRLVLAQIIGDSLAAVLIFLIAVEILPF